ncbi:PREDICTED: ERC protein 2-like, partial [Rhagoletis zephyria]|uniref:ERC protein 2-like n=1 Tax=Rhagoletis zephyria TaxID=28612 RepID=UPI00081155B2
MEHLPTSLSTSSAYGHGGGFPGGGTGASAYYDDLGSPGMAAMDGGLGPGGGGRGPMHRMGRRPPLRSYHSIEREPGYRDRSFDRMDSLNARAAAGGHLSRARDRSLDRALYASRDDPMQGSYGGPLRDRDGALLDDPALGVGGPYGGRGDPLVGGHVGRHMGPGPGLGPGGGGLVGDPRGGPYGGSGGIGGGGMGGRMGAVNDNFVMELQARLNDLQNQFSSVKRELDATTQKLGSSMHSIKTFWSPELKKERALRKEEAAKYALINDQLKILRSENQKQSALIRQLEEELRITNMRNPDQDVQQHLDSLYSEKEHMSKEIYLLRETNKELELRIETQKQTLAARDDSIKKLMEMLQNKGIGSKMMEEERIEYERMRTRNIELETRQRHIDKLKMELNKRDQELLAVGAKMKTLEEQHQDYQRHISVLKESLVAKEEHYNMLQADIEELRSRLEEKNKLIEKRTHQSMMSSQDKNKLNLEMQELRDHIDIKDRKINVLQRK